MLMSLFSLIYLLTSEFAAAAAVSRARGRGVGAAALGAALLFLLRAGHVVIEEKVGALGDVEAVFFHVAVRRRL